MRYLTAFSACLLLCSAAYSQENSPVKRNPNKSGIGGTIITNRKQPVAGIKAFVYAKDSIVSSGYCDEKGCFETGFTIPGTYDVKLVYPSDKVVLVTGVPVKKKAITPLYLKMALPEADTTIAYNPTAFVAPPPPPKDQVNFYR